MSARPAFDAALAHAAAIANRAPSSHNSQPWSLFVVDASASRAPLEALDPTVRDTPLLVLGLDRCRSLGALDAHDAEMMMSCGMYLHLLLDALANRGYEAVPLWRTGKTPLTLPGWPETDEPLFAVALRSAEATEDPDLDAHSARRITNRAPYRDDPIPTDALERLRAVRTRLEAGATLNVDHQLDPQTVRQHGEFVARHAHVDFTHHAAWSETHSYIRFSEAALAEAVDGFPITQLFGPLSGARRTAMRLALAPTTMRMLKYVGYPRIIAGQLGGLVGGSPATVTLAMPDPEPDRGALVVAGGLVLDYWLRATAAGLAMHPVSVILQHDDIRRRFQDRFGLEGRVVFFARLGVPEATFPPTPRRRAPVEDIIRTI